MRDLLQVKSKYLNEVTDVEDKLKLAMDYKMHSVAINVRMYVFCVYVWMYLFSWLLKLKSIHF